MKKNNIIDIHINFFLIFLTFVNLIVIYISRIGFNYEFIPLVKGSLTFIFLIFSYEIFKFIKFEIFKNRFVCFLFALLLIFISNKIKIFFGIDISYLIFFIALFQVIYFFKNNFLILFDIKILILFFFLFSIWSCSAYYSNHFIHPLMYEKIITGSWAHRDELFHSALSGMIKTYDNFSNGINGLQEIYYHYFSHYFIAQLSEFLNINTIEMYSVIYPILLIPIFFYTFFYLCSNCITILNKNIFYEDNKLFFWIFSFVLFILPLPMYWLSENYQYLRSQSYNIGLSFTFILISLTISFYLNVINKNISKFTLSDYTHFVILLLLFLIISISKFSLLYFAFMSFGFFYLRLKLFEYIIYNIIIISIIVISLLIYYNIIYNFQLNWGAHGFEISYISRLFNNPYSGPYYKYLIPTFFYILITSILLKLYDIKTLIYNIKNKNILDIEFLFILIFILYLFPYSFTGGIQIYICYFIMLVNLDKIYKFLFNK